MKTETIDFRSFMSGNAAMKKAATSGILTASGIAAGSFILTHPTMTFAKEAVSEATKAKVAHCFDPLIETMLSLSTPVASAIIAGAAFAVMLGFKDKGYSYIMNASLGYVLIHMLPLFVSLLTGVGGAIS